MNILFAALPILVILGLMIGMRWGAARAGSAGYLAALIVSIAVFGAGPKLLAYAHSRALLLTLDVLFIIWNAFLLYRVIDEAGAIRRIGDALPHLTTDRGSQALIIGWVFATFLQGVGGFGVPVAVIAPILIGLGFPPMSAVIIPSIGHGWAVTFGSLGSSFQALLSATGLTPQALAPTAALFLSLSALPTGLVIAFVSDGWKGVRRLAFPVLVLSTIMGTTQYIVAAYGPWNIASFCAGIAGLLTSIPLLNHSSKVIQGDPTQRRPALHLRALALALSGYVILILITLGIQMLPAVSKFLGQYAVIRVEFPEVQTALGYTTPAGQGRVLSLLRHAGASLFYSAILSYCIYYAAGLYSPGSAFRILNGTIKRVINSSLSIASMVTMAVVMENAGMTNSLAQGLAQATSAMFPIVAPWIGALGAFMTGSNTNSNVLFGLLQLRTAELLNYFPPVILAGQTAGAALASVVAPTKIVVGCSTAGMAGQEGNVLRSTLVYTIILVLLISLMTIIGTLIL